MRAPPSSNGAFIVMTALPKALATRERIAGAAGGPRGRCHTD